MKIWIVWLPNVWKSTLFNALTKNYSADAQNFPFCTIEANIWIVNVNDERLEQIREIVKWKKIVPATCEFIDIAWIIKWASKWEWLWNKFLATIREADAILQVVRVFEDNNIIHVNWSPNPKSDIEIVNSELILADMESIEKRIIKDIKKAKTDKKVEKAIETYNKILEQLNNWTLINDIWLDEEELDIIYDLHLLTNKKFIYACNVSEDMMDINEKELKDIIWIKKSETKVLAICAKLEEDMIWMSEEERKSFLNEMWLIDTWLDRLIKVSYDTLWLMYYFTAGETEVRAWTIKKWDNAAKAAWVIHTDFEKWFIKAEVVNWKDLIDTWSLIKAKEQAKLSLQWKDYIVKDGDIMHFKFNN